MPLSVEGDGGAERVQAPREFARFLYIARGSLSEPRDHLRDGASRGHWTDADVQDLAALCNRTTAALSGLIRYLKAPRSPNP